MKQIVPDGSGVHDALLGHVSQSAAEACQGILRRILSSNLYRPAVQGIETVDQVQERRLPRPGWPDDGGDPSCGNIQVQPLEQRLGTEGEIYLFKMDSSGGGAHSISHTQILGMLCHNLAHPVHRPLGALEGGPVAAVTAEDAGELNGEAIIGDPFCQAQRAGGIIAPAYQDNNDSLQHPGNSLDRHCQAGNPNVHPGGAVACLHSFFPGTGFLCFGAHGLDEHQVIGPLRYGGRQLGIAAVNEILHAELQPAQDKADKDIHRQRHHQGPHQSSIIAGNLQENDEAGIGGGEYGDEHLHNQITDAGNIGSDTAEQFLRVIIFIEPQGQAHRLAPDHPAQIPVHAGFTEVIDESGNRTQNQGKDLIEKVRQHHSGQTHVSGEEGGAVFSSVNAHLGNDGAGCQVADDP